MSSLFDNFTFKPITFADIQKTQPVTDQDIFNHFQHLREYVIEKFGTNFEKIQQDCMNNPNVGNFLYANYLTYEESVDAAFALNALLALNKCHFIEFMNYVLFSK